MRTQSIIVLGIHSLGEKIFTESSFVEELRKTYLQLTASLFSEKVLLVTCNRIEIYLITSNPVQAEKELKKILPVHNLFMYKNQKAVKHLFTVACGLDSIIVGELEILIQIKRAYQSAVKANTVGTLLHQLFQEAMHIGKEARAKTAIAAGSPSMAHTIVTLSQKYTDKISQPKILIIGAGTIAQQIVKNIVHHADITLTNRTYARAHALAKKYGGKTILFKDLSAQIKVFDVIISATLSSQILIPASLIKTIMKDRRQALCFIDLAVPRNIDPEIAEIKNVFLYQLEDIQKLINKNRTIRQEAIVHVQKLLDKQVKKFWTWYALLKVVPILRTLHQQAFSIRDTELKRTLQKLQHLPQKDQKIITALSMRIVNKLLAVPIKQVKKNANNTFQYIL